MEKTVDLTDDEWHFVAVSLASIAMRQGPLVFEAVETVATKLGVMETLAGVLLDFEKYNKQRDNDKDSNKT